MCKFFSFVTDFNNKKYYFNSDLRKQFNKENPKKYSMDSHSSICDYFGLNDDKVNKYEFTSDKLIIDQINTKDSTEKVEKWIKDFSITEEFKNICLEAIKQDGWTIRFISNPTDEMKLEAVKQNGRAIRFISNPTNETKLDAVKQDGWTIRFISNPTNEMKLDAVKQDGRAIQFISNPTDEMILSSLDNLLKLELGE